MSITEDEAKIIARVVADVDGHCHVCAGEAAAELLTKLPEQDWAQLIAAEHYDFTSENDWAERYAKSIRERAAEISKERQEWQ